MQTNEKTEFQVQLEHINLQIEQARKQIVHEEVQSTELQRQLQQSLENMQYWKAVKNLYENKIFLQKA